MAEPMTPREHAIIAMCRMAGHSLDGGWRSFDNLEPAEMIAFAEGLWPHVRKTLPILERQFEIAMGHVAQQEQGR